MSLVKNIFLNFSKKIPVGILKKISPIDIYLPYQHLIREAHTSYISHLYPFKNKKQFETDLDYLLKNFRIADIDQLVSYVKRKGELTPNQFLLTFDDGFKEIATVIAPLLYQKGIPAIFFLNNDFIGNNQLFYRLKISLLIEELSNKPQLASVFKKYFENSNDLNSILNQLKKTNQFNQSILDNIANEIGLDFDDFLKSEKPFATKEQIEEIVKMGFYVGGHSLSHPYFELLSEAEQYRQAVDSAKRIANEFHQKYTLFAFPHYDNKIKTKTIQKILNGGVDVIFGIQNQLPELQLRMLHRFNAERPNITMEQQIKAEMLYAALLKRAGKFSVKRN